MIRVSVPRSHLQKFNVRTHPEGAYDQIEGSPTFGEFIETVPVIITDIKGSIQPAKPRNLKNLPEGMDPDDTWVIHTSAYAFIMRNKNQLPDEAQFNGRWYTLVRLDEWQKHGHSKGIFSRYDRTRS